jgi:hypothetical protein
MTPLSAATSSKVRAAAMRAWSFLYTSLRHSPSSDALQPLLPVLAAALHDGDVDVRGAAGEALTLVYHTNRAAAGSSSDEEGWEEEGCEEEGAEDMSVEAPNQLPGLGDVVDRMKQLATNKGEVLRRSKRDKAALRGVFRELCGALQVGAPCGCAGPRSWEWGLRLARVAVVSARSRARHSRSMRVLPRAAGGALLTPQRRGATAVCYV